MAESDQQHCPAGRTAEDMVAGRTVEEKEGDHTVENVEDIREGRAVDRCTGS